MGLPTAHGIAASRRSHIATIADHPEHFCPDCTMYLGAAPARHAQHRDDCDGDAVALVRRITPANRLEN